MMLCSILPTQYTADAVTACQPTNVTHAGCGSVLVANGVYIGDLPVI